MFFYDKVKVKCISGKGWDWVVSARRETFIPYGWPAWGNGGRGWDIIFKASGQELTLLDFRYKKTLKSKPWEMWGIKEQYGKNALDAIFSVPVGTFVRDVSTGEFLFEFTQEGQEYIVAKWGQWGIGNMHFATSTHQYPQFALLWEPGQEVEVELELQLMGDVALIGTPSVGKSSIISAVSNVKAKIADYPFTTLVPQLWVVQAKGGSFTVVDVPGLIEGAHLGKGLGNEFLRHILKARVWAIVLDISRFESGIQEFDQLMQELIAYSVQWRTPEITAISLEADEGGLWFILKENGHIVFKKRLLFVLNKADLVEDKEVRVEYQSELFQLIKKTLYNLFSFTLSRDFFLESQYLLSAVTQEGLTNRVDHCYQIVSQLSKWTISPSSSFMPIKKQKKTVLMDVTQDEQPKLLEKWLIEEGQHVVIYLIDDDEVARLAYMIPRWNDEAEIWFWNVLNKQWLMKKLAALWFMKWDILKIPSRYRGLEDRYVQY